MATHPQLRATMIAFAIVMACGRFSLAQKNYWVLVDAPRVVSAKDVTPESYAQDSRIIEIILSPSARCYEWLKKDTILRLNYRIETAFPVVDYLPSTTLSCAFAENIDVDTSVSEFSGRIFYSVSPRSGKVEANTHATKSKVTYSLLPPLDTLIESGFDNMGRGVFFTFRSHNQTTLAGRKDIAILLRVPKTFQADYLTVRVSGEMENEEAVYSTTAMIKHSFEDEFDVAYYIAMDNSSADMHKHAERFVNDQTVAECAKKLHSAINQLEKDKEDRLFTSPPQRLKDAVVTARQKFESARNKVRSDFRSANNGDHEVP
jgi:hypothetical protein